MRCNNCGWDNAPGATSCVKCGHSINTGNGYNANPYQEVNVPNYGPGEQAPRPTVVNATGMAEPAPRPTVVNATGQMAPQPRPTRIMNGPQQMLQQGTGEAQNARSCPHCGYPVMGNFTSCPNCGTPMAAANPQPAAPKPAEGQDAVKPFFDLNEKITCQKCGTEVTADYSFCPKCGERIHMPTVRAIRHKPTPPKPKCSLTLIPEEEEKMEPKKCEYEGSSVILTRENTEPDNRTITSKEQAEISCEDGKWYIVNKSELGSTFIECTHRFEIQPGDVIVLGDRRFKFDAEAQQK